MVGIESDIWEEEGKWVERERKGDGPPKIRGEISQEGENKGSIS